MLKSFGNKPKAFKCKGQRNDQLLQAAADGDLERVCRKISKGAQVDCADENGGWTPLHAAACWGTDDVVRALLEAGAIVDARDKAGATPLMLASSNGRTVIVRTLLKLHANVNMLDQESNSALQLAGANNHKDVVALLLEYGAETELKPNDPCMVVAAKAVFRAKLKATIERKPSTDYLDLSKLTCAVPSIQLTTTASQSGQSQTLEVSDQGLNGPEPLFATALFDYNPEHEGELLLHAGDLIMVENPSGEWWLGRVDGRRGWFPPAFVAMHNDRNESMNSSLNSSMESLNSDISSSSLNSTVTSLVDGEGANDDAQRRRQRKPLRADNCVKHLGPLIYSDEGGLNIFSMSEEWQTLVEMAGIESQRLHERKYARTVLAVLDKLVDAYIENGNAEELQAGGKMINTGGEPLWLAIAVEEYASREPRHLSLFQGDIVYIVDDAPFADSSDWWLAQTLSGKLGFVPRVCLQRALNVFHSDIYDVFLTYRVTTQARHAEMLYLNIRDAAPNMPVIQRPIRVFLDKKKLSAGSSWCDQFSSALYQSVGYVPLMSLDGVIEALGKLEPENGNDWVDSVLLELSLAVEMLLSSREEDRPTMKFILPVFVGREDARGFLPYFPDSVLDSQEEFERKKLLFSKLSTHPSEKTNEELKRQLLRLGVTPSPQAFTRSIRDIVAEIHKQQGVNLHLLGQSSKALEEAAKQIANKSNQVILGASAQLNLTCATRKERTIRDVLVRQSKTFHSGFDLLSPQALTDSAAIRPQSPSSISMQSSHELMSPQKLEIDSAQDTRSCRSFRSDSGSLRPTKENEPWSPNAGSARPSSADREVELEAQVSFLSEKLAEVLEWKQAYDKKGNLAPPSVSQQALQPSNLGRQPSTKTRRALMTMHPESRSKVSNFFGLKGQPEDFVAGKKKGKGSLQKKGQVLASNC